MEAVRVKVGRVGQSKLKWKGEAEKLKVER